MVEKAPSSVRARTVIANLLISEGKFDEARTHIEKGMEIYDRHPRLLEVASIVAFNDGDYKLAKKYALYAMDNIKPPSALRAAIIYSMVLAKEGRYNESLQVIRNYVVYIEPQQLSKNSSVKFVFALNHYKLGDRIAAEKYFDWDLSLTREEKISIIEEF
jgi:tetratricopeptide (TPR) repeat protein